VSDSWDCTRDGVTEPCGECPACTNALAQKDAMGSVCDHVSQWVYAPEADLIQVVVKEPDGSWTVCDPQPKEDA